MFTWAPECMDAVLGLLFPRRWRAGFCPRSPWCGHSRGASVVQQDSASLSSPSVTKFYCENACSKLADPQVMITGDYLLTAIAIAKNVASQHIP